MKTIILVISGTFLASLLIFVLVSAMESNETFGFSKWDNRFNRFKWGCRLLLLLIVVGCIFIKKWTTNKDSDFNDGAKICGLGCYDNTDKVSSILDSLCNHHCVKFGEIYYALEDLCDIHFGRKCQGGYVVGCIDTISGDRLEIRLSVSQDEIYSPVDESYEISYDNYISQISLINSKGITKSNVAIADDYLVGGKGYDNGYRTLLNDTCAILYRKQ